MAARSPVRFRVKGTKIYAEHFGPLQSPYTTTGHGRRSVAMRSPNYGPNAALQFSGHQLRAQSHAAARNNGYAARIADSWTANLVGTGIVPQPPDAKARNVFKLWTDVASADGTLDYYGIQAQCARGVVLSGEVFVRFRVRSKSDGLIVPLQLQVLEADYIPLELNRMTDNGGYIRQGIEFNAIGQRVAYWMFRQHPADASVLPVYDAMPYRVPASEVLHIYDALARPGQIRGEPWLTRALAKLNSVDDYDDFEGVRKKVVSLMAGFITRNVPEEMSEDDLVKAWGKTAKIGPDGVGELLLEPGALNYLEPGEEVTWSTPPQDAQYEPFIKQQLRAVAIAGGILYEQLSGDMGNLNDRTWRAAFNEFKRRCEMLQHAVVVFQLCRPVWSRFAALARIVGALTAAETPDIVPHIPQAWPYINPPQDIAAQIDEIRGGLASRSQKVSERGRDSADVDAEQAADNERADAAGVKYDSDGRNPARGEKIAGDPSGEAPETDENEPPKAPAKGKTPENAA